ncbi:MAG: tripartite tricarboxylate transporter substrate binding protein [Pirellulaceae bacterium]
MRSLFQPLLILSLLVSGCQPASQTTGDSSRQRSDYPRRTVTIVCPWGVGGGTDRISRYFAGALRRELGKPFVVVNKTGGSGVLGHSSGANAKPDGYTITTITAELNTMHQLRLTKLTYQNFIPLLQMNADAAAIIVRQDAPWTTLANFLDYIRKQPGQLKMSGTAAGGTWDLARVGMLQAAGLNKESTRWVPTQGAASSLTELLGGHLDAVCCSVPEAAQQIADMQLRVLAVMSQKRLSNFPDIPTVKESGIDWTAVGWRGLALPNNTPPDIVAQLSAACKRIVESPQYREYMNKEGFGITIRHTEDFEAFLKDQDAQWGPVVASFIKKKS